MKNCLGRAAMVLLLVALPLSVIASQGSGGTLSTLYSHDALSQTLCFGDGRYGNVVQDGEVRNRCSDIDFDHYVPGSFSAGIEGGRVAAITDLGTEDELASKYGFEQTISKGQGFASIQLRDGKLRISKNRRSNTLQELAGVEGLGRMRSVASSAIRTGHIYIVHITDEHDRSVDTFVKLVVVSFTPGESVTFRWDLL